MTPSLSPGSLLALMPRPGARPVFGDVAVYGGVGGSTLVIEASDLAGVVKIRTEMALDEYDQEKVDRFAASWRAKMARRRKPKGKPLHIVP